MNFLELLKQEYMYEFSFRPVQAQELKCHPGGDLDFHTFEVLEVGIVPRMSGIW